MAIMENPVHYLHIYLFISYYVGAVPFRLKRDSKTGLMEFHENVVQKVICATVHIYGAYQFIPALFIINLFNPDSNSIAVFDLAALAGGLGYQLSVMVAVWFRKELFIEICDQIHGNELLVERISGKHKIQGVMIVLGFIFGATALTYVVLASGLMKSSEWSPEAAFQSYVSRARLMLAWSTAPVKPDALMTPLNTFLTSTYLGLKILSRIQFHFSDYSILMFALLMHHLARDFVVGLKSGGVGNGLSFEKIKTHFNAVKDIVGTINKLYGNVFLWWIFESMPYYAGHFDLIFKDPDILQQSRQGQYFLVYMLTLFIAADAHSKIGRFKDWLSEEDNYSSIDVGHITVLLNELSSHTIGMNGKDFLTIHYDFFSAMVSLILTYAIIVVEFRTAGASFFSYNNIL